MEPKILRRKIMGCWLGKAVGGTLGMPYEGLDGPFDLDFYRPVPTGMVPNDDLDLQVVWACLLDKQKSPVVSRSMFIEAWLNHIDFPWDEYGVCIRNLREGILPPLSGSFDNWFRNGMGAAIRSEIWACLAPGDPALAAKYAYEDACLDHADHGLWAEVWLAAMQSAAFVECDIRRIVQIGLEHIPADAEFRAALEDTYLWWENEKDWKAVRLNILKKYGHGNFTNVTENMAFILLALLDGNGDFSRSICTANNCGKDTDCTAATVGALLGIIEPDCIDEKWLKPIGRKLILSKEITGIQPPENLDDFTDLVLRLHERLQQKPPVIPAEPALPDHYEIQASIGFKDVPWFGQGWQPSRIPQLEFPQMTPNRLPGTVAQFDTKDIPAGAVFVNYGFALKQDAFVRVLFNTEENCRVFVDGEYRFGRECGRVAPSPHRVPINQYCDLHLTAGEHTLTGVVQKPLNKSTIEWIVCVSDKNRNDQHIPNVWKRKQTG